MENFTPLWDIKSESEFIQESADILVTTNINKDPDDKNTSYVLKDGEYILIQFLIETKNKDDTSFVAEDHYTLYAGEDVNNLKNITTGITKNKSIAGNHYAKLTKEQFDLIDENTSPIWYFKLHCKNNGTFDSIEITTFTIVSVTRVSPSDSITIGTITTSLQSITYNSTEFWVTPGVVVGDDNNNYCIGDISFGNDSTLFVQAFGRKVPGTTPRVFYPIYRLMSITEDELPQTDITGKRAILFPQKEEFPITGNNKEVKVNILDETTKTYDTGLVFNPNGQFLQAFLYDSSPYDLYFKVQIQDIESSYTNDSERYAISQSFKSGQMFLCPSEFDFIYSNDVPVANHLYQLKSGVTYPYVVDSDTEDGLEKPVFNSDDWVDLGLYDKTLGTGIIGETKIFRMLANSGTSGKISFITDSDLGTIHVGEYFGHSTYPVIETDSEFNVSFKIVSGSDITKYGLELKPNGYLCGTAYAKSTDFTANDDIPLEFEVEAYDTSGLRNTKTFQLRIIRGFGENYISSHLVPSVQFEREWFKCISSTIFGNQQLFRISDERYGLQKVPRILLKENYVSQDYNYNTLKELKRVLRKNIIDENNIPQGTFNLVMGNYKVLSCLDNLGNLQYDLLFREVHPSGSIISVSNNPRSYSIKNYTSLTEVFGLRQNLFNAIGEDTTNLITDPDDLNNRGLYVTGLDSSQMLDTVPRFMNHPYEGDGLSSEFMVLIPVAYCLPGKGDDLFYNLYQNNEHKLMVGTEFEVPAVEFITHVGYMKEKFQIILQKS